MKRILNKKTIYFAVSVLFSIISLFGSAASSYAQVTPDTQGSPTTGTSYATSGLVNCGNVKLDAKGNPIITGGVAGSNDSSQPCTVYHLFGIIARLTNFLIACAGFFAIFTIIRAAQSMVLAMGNPESLTSAKNDLTNAVLGFALVLIAFILAQFIFAFLGINANPTQLITNPFNYLTGK